MKPGRKKILKAGLGAIVFAAIVLVIITKVSASGEQEEKPGVFNLAKMDITESISATGRVESVTRENVSATADGKIKTVNVQVGDQVKQGDVLAVLDTTSTQRDLEKSYNSKKSEIVSAKMELDLKSRDYNNAKILFEEGAISQNDLLKAENDYKKSVADYESKQNSPEITGLKQKISDATIKAPIDGTVTMVNAAAGTVSSGVLFTIEDVADLKVTASVSEYDINSVKVGQKAVIKTEMTGETELAGEITSIPPTSEKDAAGKPVTGGKVQFSVQVSIKDKNENVKIGTNARVNIITAGKEDVFAVPLDALKKNAGGSSIYAVKKQGSDYVVKEIRVKTGLENDFYVEVMGKEIKEGLKVLNNPENFAAGQKIEVV